VTVKREAVEGPLRGILVNHDRLARSVSEENRALSALFDQLPDCPVSRVALLATDVHDLEGLGTMADLLFGSAPVG
jgi:hypothetical protein